MGITFHYKSLNVAVSLFSLSLAFYDAVRLRNLVPRVSHLTAPWSERGETLAHAGHVSPRIWEMTENC